MEKEEETDISAFMQGDCPHMELSDEEASALSKFPNLKRYYEFFRENDGSPERDGHLPNLIVWIRYLIESDDVDEYIDPSDYFDMDEEDAEEFHSWGHNSRWWNVFVPYATSNLDIVLPKCIELAEKYGDPNLETIFPQ